MRELNKTEKEYLKRLVLYSVILKKPGVNGNQIVNLTGFSNTFVYDNLKKLLEMGWIQEFDGKYFPKIEIEILLTKDRQEFKIREIDNDFDIDQIAERLLLLADKIKNIKKSTKLKIIALADRLKNSESD